MDVGFASEPLAKRKTAGAGRLWDGMLRIRTMLADQVLGRLAILALTLLVVLALKVGGKRVRRVLLDMRGRNSRCAGGRCGSYESQADRRRGAVEQRVRRRYFT